ncbi:hypothetical protein BS47DRAFT_846792 [Hydnum rufescens UP504]|uniref:S-adenosyl-L-methionine-dependent methyltransferase n=1 Tax=Hydnum rufescens UP504 TaxID=1448309 RepID=A0A9P6B9M3_9AGAM|nr:hypothetical protein BS47DRAFT_846792 [Hydnum rufescens UP504]
MQADLSPDSNDTSSEVDTISDYGASMDISSMDGGESSTGSVFSFDMRRDGDLFLKVHGRMFNAQNPLYTLPADEIEWGRLDKQHRVHLLALGGLYQAPETVTQILIPEFGVDKRILDCGAGGGNWAIAMAEEFPHVEVPDLIPLLHSSKIDWIVPLKVIGVDLAPRTGRPPPPNCRFEFDDVTLGLPHYHGQFDVVHAQSSANGIRDFPQFIHEMVQCLKPGGILLIVEGDLQLYGEDFEPMEAKFSPESSGSWMNRLLFETYSCAKFRGSAMDAGRFLLTWLQQNQELENEQGRKIFTPIGPWLRGDTEAETGRLMFIGELMRQNSKEFVRGWKPMLLEEGSLKTQWIGGSKAQMKNLPRFPST